MTTKNIKPNCDIVIGLVYGDEGKGKITNYLAFKSSSTLNNPTQNLCIRYNGGPNAGHTIYINKQKIVTHQVPTGVLYGMTGLIGDNCYIDLYKLNNELLTLEKLTNDYTIRSRLFISSNAHIILKNHIQQDCSDTVIGTTRSGIGPCAIDKYGRSGKRIKDNMDHICNIIPSSNIIDSYLLIQKKVKNNNYIIVEGAQGFGLDINHGDYPYVTSSHCCATDCLNIGIPIKYIRNIYGVCKAYDTYVGAKQFQNINDNTLKAIQIQGEEYGATTGRVRQCEYLNMDFLIKSININNCTHVIINKCDIIKTIGTDAYKYYYQDKLINFSTFEQMIDSILNNISLNTYVDIENIKLSFSKTYI